MRSEASILHLDLDAFFAAVEQRDKPSLRGRPVIVGGIGGRGVVATASYEARQYGARSAMPTAEARRRCPAGTAFLSGRFPAYRKSSAVVMQLLAELSPVVEQVSIDEAYVDLAAGGVDLSVDGVTAVGRRLLDGIRERTGGLTASAGIASSKLMAKIGSELRKPAGLTVVPPGRELEVLHPLPVTVIGGVGPATAERLRTFGVQTVADLARVARADLVSILGQAHGTALHQLARAIDDRPVVTEREAKSVSAEETFDVDVADDGTLHEELRRLAARVTERLVESGLFARTITIKARHHDFSTVTRSSTLGHATADPATVLDVAGRLLRGLDTTGGLRLLGVGVSGLADHAQDELRWTDDPADTDADASTVAVTPVAAGTDATAPPPGTAAVPEPVDPEEEPARPTPNDDAGRASGRSAGRVTSWRTGQDVRHTRHGAGWVWGSGAGRVTVRFEGPDTPPGPVRTFAVDDPALTAAEPPDWRASALRDE